MEERLASIKGVYATARPKPLPDFSPATTWDEKPRWMKASPKLVDGRVLMLEQPDLDCSDWSFSTISYARHHAMEERERYRQMVRSFRGRMRDPRL